MTDLPPLPDAQPVANNHPHYTIDQLRAYALAERAAERERCTQLCEAAEAKWMRIAKTCGGDDVNEVCRAQQAGELAEAIRGQT